MITWLLSISAVIIISLISMVGITALWLKEQQLKKILLYMVSFSAGALFGDAFIHLIPEAIEETGFGLSISALILFGILFSFIVEKFLRWRHCHIPTSSDHPHSFAYMNLFGDAIHNLIDGLIVGGSFVVNISVGIATTLAVIFHEIPQELGDFGVLVHGGFSKRKALWFNLLTALTAVFGTILALTFGQIIEGFTPLLLSFAAGNFIYIAGSDLIPELRKDEANSKKAAMQIVSICLGIFTMLLILLFE
ncbi:MAG: ZIP family metal transporter [Candidatus Bathyarchaeota archaeon]|nr:ZIP family metal transporter [Candidatus Bathyarchaeota archaeon]